MRLLFAAPASATQELTWHVSTEDWEDPMFLADDQKPTSAMSDIDVVEFLAHPRDRENDVGFRISF